MTAGRNPEADPGWPGGLSALRFLIPGVMQRQARKPGVEALFMLRQLTQSFTASLVLFGVVLPFTKPRTGQVAVFALILAAIATASVVLARRLDPPLDCSTPTALVGSYRTRFFLRVAFAQTVALFGSVFAFTGGTVWLYYAGAAFTLIRLWTAIAPTRAALESDQRQLDEGGCTLSLITALRSLPTAAN